jgi:hypothetical protein
VNTFYISAVALDSNRVLVSYKNVTNSGFGEAVVLTITGNTITYGTPIVFNNVITNSISTVALDSNRVLVSYQNNSYAPYGGETVVLTITGNAITYFTPTPVPFNTVNTSNISAVALDSNRVVVSYKNATDAPYAGEAVVLTITGTTITYGAIVAFNGVYTSDISAVKLDSNRVVVCYRNGSTFGNAVVLTITGITISNVGTPVAFNAVNTAYITAVALDSNRVLVSYHNGISTYGNAVVLTITGTTITYGAIVVFNGVYTTSISAVALDSNRVLVSYRNNTSSNYGNAVVLTITGTGIVAETPIALNDVAISYISAVKLDSNRVLVNYRNDNSNYGNAVRLLYTPLGLTKECYIVKTAISSVKEYPIVL